MFDIGFWELTIIFLLAVIILGPERLVTSIRVFSDTISSLKKFANSMKTELVSELDLQEQLKELKATHDNITSDTVLKELNDETKTITEEIDKLNKLFDNTKKEIRETTKTL